ncbi:GIY-YIG nuclease family protein [Brochothrix campestris]|uniref:Uncharacterized protein n=1 Tax=Brochothrix campestris FSL F6-1037 TaxID=1265861 RepID=W7CX70_9LIST|nr:hypothetical protein [Brochothrix campestris]EUJ37648.1 hypothetical protein BCAMP_09810 [Brochothrix campestris FSL F6-1037]
MTKDVFYLPSFKQLTAQKEALTEQPWYSFDSIDDNHITTRPGVYCIASSKDKGASKQIIYINQTDNLKNHLTSYVSITNITTSKLEKALVNDPHLTAIRSIEQAHIYLKNDCYYKFSQIDDTRERLFLEHSLKFTLSPRYLTVRAN